MGNGRLRAYEENFFAAYQHLIDSGMAWTLQGRIGRQAAALIENGDCVAAQEARQ